MENWDGKLLYQMINSFLNTQVQNDVDQTSTICCFLFPMFYFPLTVVLCTLLLKYFDRIMSRVGISFVAIIF